MLGHRHRVEGWKRISSLQAASGANINSSPHGDGVRRRRSADWPGRTQQAGRTSPGLTRSSRATGASPHNAGRSINLPLAAPQRWAAVARPGSRSCEFIRADRVLPTGHPKNNPLWRQRRWWKRCHPTASLHGEQHSPAGIGEGHPR